MYFDIVKALVRQDDRESQVLLYQKLVNLNLGLDCQKFIQHFGADQDCVAQSLDLDIQFAVEAQQNMGDALLPLPVLNAYSAAVPQKFVRDATRFDELITALEVSNWT